MHKVIALIRRNPSLSAQEFRDYWTNVHVPMIKERMPDLLRYTGTFRAPGASDPTYESDLDLVVELGFKDLETLKKNVGGTGFMAPDREASSARLMDMTTLTALVGEEIDVS